MPASPPAPPAFFVGANGAPLSLPDFVVAEVAWLRAAGLRQFTVSRGPEVVEEALARVPPAAAPGRASVGGGDAPRATLASDIAHALCDAYRASERAAATALDVLWDIENVPVPMARSGTEAVERLRDALVLYGRVDRVRAYGSLLSCGASERTRSELQLAGVHLVDAPHRNRKEVADKMILVDAMEIAVHNNTAAAPSSARGIVVITGDTDFAYLFARLRALRSPAPVILVAPRAATAKELLLAAPVVLAWETDVLRLAIVDDPRSARSMSPQQRGRRASPVPAVADDDDDGVSRTRLPAPCTSPPHALLHHIPSRGRAVAQTRRFIFAVPSELVPGPYESVWRSNGCYVSVNRQRSLQFVMCATVAAAEELARVRRFLIHALRPLADWNAGDNAVYWFELTPEVFADAFGAAPDASDEAATPRADPPQLRAAPPQAPSVPSAHPPAAAAPTRRRSPSSGTRRQRLASPAAAPRVPRS